MGRIGIDQVGGARDALGERGWHGDRDRLRERAKKERALVARLSPRLEHAPNKPARRGAEAPPAPPAGVDDTAQAGLIVFKLEFAAVQAGNRRREAETQPGARSGAALFEADESFHRAAAIGFGNTGTAVRYRQHDPVAVSLGAHHDFRPDAVGRAATARRT